MDRSPLAPKRFATIPPVAGVSLATAATGLKYKGRDDVLLALCAPESIVAGVFTTSSTRSAPVLDCQEKVTKDTPDGLAIFVNAGNANAFTGARGDGTVEAITRNIAQTTGLSEQAVFTASTGVIGEPLDPAHITPHIQTLFGSRHNNGFEAAAEAIRTTDTFAKGASRDVMVDGKPVRIAGIAKGSGMIAPDMATMLVFLFTDALLPKAAAQSKISTINARSFNCITVDSDTSTSDTLLFVATGQSGQNCEASESFDAALEDLMLDLAHQVVRDGEGATKFVEVNVSGATSPEDARRVAGAIANSPLVKTAIAGEDPNWGRIVMAVGKSGAQADRDKLTISFGDILVAENGWVSPNYSEEIGSNYMKAQELTINVDLGLGSSAARMWTCDLTHQYITINADYRS
ncbi:MAG: bifunctional glutamate N-acetyltransferase/amino-acid acetyltransferase ArgJ [Pseudomonadota bacterium]